MSKNNLTRCLGESDGVFFLPPLFCSCVPGEVEKAVFGGVKFLCFWSCAPGEILVIKGLRERRMARI